MHIRHVEAVATEIRHTPLNQLTTRSHSIVTTLLAVISDLQKHCEEMRAKAKSSSDANAERSLKAIADRLSNLHSLVESMLQDTTLSIEERRVRLQSAATAVLSVQRAHETMFGSR